MPSLTRTLAYAPCIETLGKKLRDHHTGATAEFDVLPMHLSPDLHKSIFARTIANRHQFYVKILAIEACQQQGEFEIRGKTFITSKDGTTVICEVRACFQEKLRGKHGKIKFTWNE